MKISLNTQIFLGATLGIAFGFILGHTSLLSQNSSFCLSFFDLIGQIFITLLKIIMIPLVFSSICSGIANLQNSPHARRIWPTLLSYSLITTALAASTGLLAMNLIKAGVGQDMHLFKDSINNFQAHSYSLADFGHSLVKNIFYNPLAAIGQNNILAVVIFAALIGIILILLGKRAKNLIILINQFFEIMIKIVGLIMLLAPLGIMALITRLIAQANWQLLFTLSKYILVVVGTTLFHGLVTLPLILWLVTRITPLKFFQAMREALITAFSTSSSTATLPVSIRCITENLKIDPVLSRFVLPVGATLNMDGTAMYEAMAALFVANLCGIHLALSSQIIVALTAMLASIGAPGIPSAGMVTMIMVLQSVGLPASAVAILIAVDRPLDTIRTVVNVEGDCMGACVVQQIMNQRIFSKRI